MGACSRGPLLLVLAPGAFVAARPALGQRCCRGSGICDLDRARFVNPRLSHWTCLLECASGQASLVNETRGTTEFMDSVLENPPGRRDCSDRRGTVLARMAHALADQSGFRKSALGILCARCVLGNSDPVRFRAWALLGRRADYRRHLQSLDDSHAFGCRLHLDARCHKWHP
jgi:hypothetical protein